MGYTFLGNGLIPGQSAGAPYAVKPSTWSFFDSFDSGWSDYYAAGTVSTDTVVTSDGGAAQKLILPGNGGQAGALRAITSKNFSRDHFRIRIRSNDWANVTACELLFMNDAGTTNTWRLNLTQYVQDRTSDEWIDVPFTRQRFAATGSPDWATIQFLLVRAQAANGTTPTVWFDALATYKQGPKGYVTLTCDDGWVSQYTEMYPRMAAKGWRGTDFVIPSVLGTTGYSTAAQVDEMHDRGWEISGHGAVNLSTLTQAQRLADLAATRAWLDVRGYRGRDLYAYPNGACGKAVQTDVAEYFSYGRGIDFLNQPVGYINNMRVNALTPTNATTLQYMEDAVDSAVLNGEWLVFGMHKFLTDTTGDAIAVTISDFQALLDYIAATGVDVLPMGEVLARVAAVAELPFSAQPGYQRIRRQAAAEWDFLGGLTGTPFTASATGAGAGVVPQSSFSFDAVGTVQANTGTTSAGEAGAVTTAGGILGGSGSHRLTMRAQLAAVPDGTDDYIARFGFIDAATGTPVDGAWFETDRAASTTAWRIVTSSNTTTTKSTTSVVFDDDWHTFTIVLAGTAPTVSFTIDDVPVGSATTNIPLNSARAFGIGFSIVKVSGTGVSSLRWDYATYQCDLAVAR